MIRKYTYAVDVTAVLIRVIQIKWAIGTLKSLEISEHSRSEQHRRDLDSSTGFLISTLPSLLPNLPNKLLNVAHQQLGLFQGSEMPALLMIPIKHQIALFLDPGFGHWDQLLREIAVPERFGDMGRSGPGIG